MSYEILYADFPWPYTSFGTAKLPYGHMTEEQIAAFDFRAFMAKRAVLFSWATGPKLDVALRCGEAWASQGLYYQGIAYIWIKTRQDGAPIGASGPRPRLVKPLGELVLAYSTHPKERVFPLLTEAQSQYVFAPKAPRGAHSKKPGVVRARIVELLGDRPRIELFAREVVAGWAGWGDEYPLTAGTASVSQLPKE